jgi:hypothetical protein
MEVWFSPSRNEQLLVVRGTDLAKIVDLEEDALWVVIGDVQLSNVSHYHVNILSITCTSSWMM